MHTHLWTYTYRYQH